MNYFSDFLLLFIVTLSVVFVYIVTFRMMKQDQIRLLNLPEWLLFSSFCSCSSTQVKFSAATLQSSLRSVMDGDVYESWSLELERLKSTFVSGSSLLDDADDMF